MKRFLIIAVRVLVFVFIFVLAGPAVLASFARGAPERPAQAACGADQVADRIPDHIDVPGGELTLADFLPPSGCAARRKAAAGVRLGLAPMAGSARVFAGAELQAQIGRLAAKQSAMHTAIQTAMQTTTQTAKQDAPESENGGLRWASLSVPERITIRRRGARASCADLAKRILAGLARTSPGSARAELTAPRLEAPQYVDCGAADRIPQDAPVEVIRATWNAALETWDISARCVHPVDCVPFLIRLPGGDSRMEKAHPALVRLALRENPRREQLSQAAEVATINPVINSVIDPFINPFNPPLNLLLNPRLNPPLVRSGDNAILSWDRNGIRLQVPVVCLTAGALGGTVRARIAGTGRTLEATVAAPGQLRAFR